MSPRLEERTLPELAGALSVPSYDRRQVRRGIVHLGVGGFHRAHEAMYVDRLMEQGVPGALDWGICGVGVLPHDRRIVETLTAQDGLYTLVTKHADGRREARVVGAVVQLLLAPDDPQAVVDAMADPATRIVSLTITEGGYLVHQVTGEFDAADPSIQADLRGDGPPTTAFGLVVAALAARRAAGTGPFTVMSCDNLPGNGDIARRVFTAFARLKDPGLADWVDEHVTFPDSMVDRITPVTTPEDVDLLRESTGVEDGWPVVCEPFTQWVLEDRFAAGRPPWEEAGVQVVDDVAPFELMKLRLLNGGHQALGYLGALAGYTYTHEVCQDPLFAGFLLDYLEHEAAPTLPPVPDTDLTAYRQTLVQRFANPEVRDTLARLCAESSDRIPKFVLPVVHANLAGGGPVDRAALVVAAWARYAEGRDDLGRPLEVVDRNAPRLTASASRQAQDPLAFLRHADIFGRLAHDKHFASAYTSALAQLQEHGARATLESFATDHGPGPQRQQ
ncbi:mannitol dehydrogenase family protein [Ornithinimicrobium sediminis]|uniref:mannitol dehydrogenase family protein n=1 Tax=Ornithinimicrobium sediminis TaxID=2904603 RepID=UPI001E498487|nr:mannitol dehydrogenase family protein [Ornithinimicrobium sediminis]